MRLAWASAMGAVRIGISGWVYPRWRKRFYPEGLAQKDELRFAGQSFNTVEVNGSFYSLLRPTAVARWYDETPNSFVFSVKGSRFITHMKRLRDVELALANFFASGILLLREKLGPILWQLPPTFAFDPERLGNFFTHLPRTTKDAARLAKKHDHRVAGRSYTKAFGNEPLRYALEVRHPSFRDQAFLKMLRQHEIALCIADTAGKYPDFDDVTADFSYVRLHGATKLYESGYSKRALENWAVRIRKWKRKGDVYVYFDNDAKVHAPFDARTLRALLQRHAPPTRHDLGVAV